MRLRSLAVCAVLGAVLLAPARAQEAKPFLSPMFGSHMVLQRGIKAPVWGWTEPGAQVTVTVAGRSATTVAGADGKWLARVGPLKVGGPYTLAVSGPQSVTLDDVLVGDVWVGSGQSNMVMRVGYSANAAQEIAAGNHPQIRLFTLPNVFSLTPQQTAGGEWQLCSPATVEPFSAAAYFFARELQQITGVPIGIVSTCWGGTPAEAWISSEALSSMPDFAPTMKQFHDALADADNGDAGFEKRAAAWYARFDRGSKAAPGWEDPALDTSAWKAMNLPAAWEDAGLPNFDGVVWFRKVITLSADACAGNATLNLGPIDDRDTTYVNGVKVGGQNQWDTVRSYTVPASALKVGPNVLTVRVLDYSGAGGIDGKPEQMTLQPASGSAIPLSGEWKYQVGVDLRDTDPVPTRFTPNPSLPSVLYNGMIEPVIPFGIKGILWYQGEANADRAYQYRALLPTLIRDWRSRWNQGAVPFYIVQLANFMAAPEQPGDSTWAELREAQAMTAASVRNSGLALAIDIGNPADIHPQNKQEVGRRLALIALAKDYGYKLEYSGPVYKAMKVEGSKIRLTFTHAEDGLHMKGEKLTGFAIAGADRKFIWADASIEGNAVIVSSPAVANPVAVRYAWADNPVCNLYNEAGLPAVPFRTDAWPGVTQPKK